MRRQAADAAGTGSTRGLGGGGDGPSSTSGDGPARAPQDGWDERGELLRYVSPGDAVLDERRAYVRAWVGG